MNPAILPKNWRKRPWPQEPDLGHCQTIASQLQMPLPMVAILFQRGLRSVEQIEIFLNPTLKQLPSPFTMLGMRQAVDLVVDAISNEKPISIYGDYDVDGVTATAVLLQFLKTLDAKVSYYLPNRLTEGYGLNKSALKKLRANTFCPDRGGLLITVDCGISDADEIEAAKRLGFSVIITDHHKLPPVLPAADVILNPLQPGCNFPYKNMAGVGVAFYLVMGVRNFLYRKRFWQAAATPNLKRYLDLVTLGTISDLAPLQGINRIFVKAGLEVMRTSQRPGIRSLLKIAKISEREITAEDIAFRIGPRINAIGRTGESDKAVQLLSTDDNELAFQLANELEHANQLRRSIQQDLYVKISKLAQDHVDAGNKTLVLSGKEWHPGIIGIVASRLTEQFCRPTILLSIDKNGQVKGSGRSIPELNLFDALTLCADCLVEYGGHDAAAGLSLKEEHIEIFKKKFEKVAAANLSLKDLEPKLTYDCRLAFSELFGEKFLYHYARLSPFGYGNPEPVFLCDKTKLVSPKRVGTDHLKFSLKENGAMRHGIGFGFGHLLSYLEQSEAEIAVNIRLNEFQGKKEWELNLVDVKIHPSA